MFSFLFQVDTLRGEAGGRNASEATRRVLYALFSKRCAVQVNWSGRNRDNETSNSKYGLSKMKLAQVIMDTVRTRFQMSETPNCVIHKAVMNWLRNSRDLHGGRKERKNKKKNDSADIENIDKFNDSQNSNERSLLSDSQVSQDIFL